MTVTQDNPLCTTRVVRDGHTLVLTLVPGAYGSADESTIRRLNADFRDAVHETLASVVIVDLSAVEIGGSGLLTALFRLRTMLHRSQQALSVCSDRRGLIAVARWEQLMQLQPGLDEALKATSPLSEPVTA